jgi:hypothetical protein
MRKDMFLATVLSLVVALFPQVTACASPAVGQRYSWKASFRAELQGDKGAQPGAASLTGEWRNTVVAVRRDGYDVRYELADVRIDPNGGPPVSATELRLAQERLQKPFWISCGLDGSLQTVHFLKEVSASDRNLLQAMATEAQFVQADATRAVWTSRESDGGGSYLAIYQRQGSSHVRKKKLKYLDADSSEASQSLRLAIDESEVVFAFTSDGAISAVDGVQRIRMSLSGVKGNSLIARFEIHLSDLHRSSESVSAEHLGIAAGVDDLPITTHESDRRISEAEMDSQLLTGQSNEQILSSATRADAVAERKLAAMFRRRPESISIALGKIADDTAGQAIASALAEASTEQSFKALSQVAHDESRPIAIRMRSLMAIEGIRKPTVEAMRSPSGLLDNHDPQIRNAARLASGALARAGREIHSGEADEIEAELVARFSRAATVEEKKEFLTALGNSAGPRARATFIDVLRDEREDLRTSAVRGLRLIPGDAIDTLLAATAKEDASAKVRGAALFAISFRLPLSDALWDAVLNAARSDSSELVRNRAISMLRNDASRRAETENALQWVAEHDPAEAVRRVARDSLTEIRAHTSSR